MSKANGVAAQRGGPTRIEWRRSPRVLVGPVALTREVVARLSPERLHSVRYLHGRAGMGNRPGLAWSESTRQLLQCESRLEMFAVHLLDFEGQVVAAVAQPFRLYLPVDDIAGKPLRHVPDFFVRLVDGGLVVIDVHRVLRAPGEGSRRILDATAVACRDAGWAYRVITEPAPVLRQNMQLVFGHRIAPPHSDQVIQAATGLLAEGPMSWDELVKAVVVSTGVHRALVLPCLFHGVWARQLEMDLTKKLAANTPVGIKDRP